MAYWFHERIVEVHRLPLFCFFVALITAFVFTRVNARLIRARVRWLGNVSVGEMHIHHVVFGVVLSLLGGVAGLVLSDVSTGWYAFSAAVFGVGAALVLDEFALILHLRDVYWQEEGRTSVDAVFVAIAATGLLLLGLRPLAWSGTDGRGGWTASAFLFVNLVFAMITLLKGKIWSGLLGLFVPPLLYVGAVRVARPGSPWARWCYSERARRPRPRLMAKAIHREERWRRPVIRVKIAVQEFVCGRHDLPAPALPAPHHRRRVVSPRPRAGADHPGRPWRSGRPRPR
ncbi:hypothetical protein [Microbispora bryophytorum]|uniref:Uncharacterized protein n=1 Tax=Microbispora bryophytorum TaxID=1460882 RepID=A0A8H9LCG7_9ACTN|nr:hypothetical protein [Microbispora bryophytorum]GGO19159.1 hypothetical protein GCM10011574_44400 [Microbispora bryophytorum]